MTITSGSMSGKPRPKALTPEELEAINFMKKIDSGMTLTRFQIEASNTSSEEVIDIDNLIKTAVFALSNIETTYSNKEKVTGLAIALEAIVLAVDALDTDLEDVAREVLDELR